MEQRVLALPVLPEPSVDHQCRPPKVFPHLREGYLPQSIVLKHIVPHTTTYHGYDLSDSVRALEILYLA